MRFTALLAFVCVATVLGQTLQGNQQQSQQAQPQAQQQQLPQPQAQPVQQAQPQQQQQRANVSREARAPVRERLPEYLQQQQAAQQRFPEQRMNLSTAFARQQQLLKSHPNIIELVAMAQRGLGVGDTLRWTVEFWSALLNGDRSGYMGRLSRRSLLEYDSDVSYAGRYMGRNIPDFFARFMSTVELTDLHAFIENVDEGARDCLVRMEYSGSFPRSGHSFTNLTSYIYMHWSAGTMKHMVISDGDYDALMAVYRTPGEKALYNFMSTIAQNGTKSLDQLLAPDVQINVNFQPANPAGQRVFQGPSGVRQMFSKIAQNSADQPDTSISLPLPLGAAKSQEMRVLFSQGLRTISIHNRYNVLTPGDVLIKKVSLWLTSDWDQQGRLRRAIFGSTSPLYHWEVFSALADEMKSRSANATATAQAPAQPAQKINVQAQPQNATVARRLIVAQRANATVVQQPAQSAQPIQSQQQPAQYQQSTQGY